MIGPARKWIERRDLLAARRPQVRVDRWVIAEGEEGYYDVVIEGVGLLPAITPPHITVGGVTLENATFEQGGRRVTGVLRELPKAERVVVDLGYMRTEGYAEK